MLSDHSGKLSFGRILTMFGFLVMAIGAGIANEEVSKVGMEMVGAGAMYQGGKFSGSTIKDK